MRIGDNKYIEYNTLTEEEKQKLRKQCVEAILGYCWEPLFSQNCINTILCLNSDNQEGTIYTENVKNVINTLKAKSDTAKLFYGNFEDSKILELVESILDNKSNIDYDTIDIHLLGQAFIKLISYNTKLMLPSEVNYELFDAYINYNLNKQCDIIRRIPYILTIENREFLLQLKDLFDSIESKKSVSLTCRNDLLQIFGPTVFKGSINKKQIHGYHRMVILEDVLNTEWYKVDVSFFDLL